MATAREVVLEARPEDIDVLQDVVADLWESEPGVADTERMRFEMALVEIFTNVVEHSERAQHGPPRRRVAVTLTVDDDRVQAVLVDDGRPAAVDLSSVTMPDADATSGRGLALAISAVDDVSYERDGDRNRWTVTCRRGS